MEELTYWKKHFASALQKRKLVIWGTGSLALRLLLWLENSGWIVECFIDGLLKKGSVSEFSGRKVFSFTDYLAAYNKADYVIVVGSSFEHQIRSRCLDAGLDEFSDFIIPPPLTYADKSEFPIDLPEGDRSTEYACRTILHENEYRLPSEMKGWTVVDIGGNVGCFVAAVVQRGAKRIFVYEPARSVIQLLEENCRNLSEQGAEIQVFNVAVAGEGITHVEFLETQWESNSMMGRIASEHEKGVLVPAMDLGSILMQSGNVDLLKVDCEGAEFGIFDNFPDEEIRKIDRICGEWHDSEEGHLKLWKLLRYFHDKGWMVTFNTSPSSCRCGGFWAVNPELDYKTAFPGAFLTNEMGVEEPIWR